MSTKLCSLAVDDFQEQIHRGLTSMLFEPDLFVTSRSGSRNYSCAQKMADSSEEVVEIVGRFTVSF